MADFKLRTSISSQGERNRPFFSRQQNTRPVPQTSYNPKRQHNSTKREQPGLYFDLNQAKDIPNFQNQLISRTQSQQSMRSKSGFAFSEKSQKLYSPYEYLHYATKINGSKEQYLNALQQLGYNQAEIFQNRPLNEIINNTNGIITKSYSVKYMGIIDGNMGILTNRKKIQSKQSQRPSQQLQRPLIEQEADKNKHQTNHFKYAINSSETSQDENQMKQLQNQENNLNEEIGGVQQVLLGDKKQNKFHQEINSQQQVSKPSEIVSQSEQFQLYQKPQKSFKVKEQKSSSQSKLQKVVTNPNTQSQINNTQQAEQVDHQEQKIPHPENYCTYLVGKYALPRGLKSLKKMRDPAILQQKLKLEQWHAEKIKVFEVSEQQGGGFSIQSSNHNKSNSSANYPHHQGMLGQTKSNFMKSNMHFSQQSSGNARMKSSLYKKPLQNYEENAEEGICYAIIDHNPNQDTVSYSKLLQHIDQVDPSQIINRIIPQTLQNKNKQLPPGVTFEQNTQLFQRYQNLETKTFIRSASPNKSINSEAM